MRILVLVLASLVIACSAYKPPKGLPERHFSMDTVDQEVCIKALEDLGYVIASVSEGSITTEKMLVHMWGNGSCGTWHDVPIQGNAHSQVTLLFGGGQIVVKNTLTHDFKGRNFSGDIVMNETVECWSRGVIEQSVIDKIKELQ